MKTDGFQEVIKQEFLTMSKRLTLLFSLLLFLSSLISAQTAADMSVLLQTDAVSAARAGRFVLGAADLLPQGLSGAAAERAAYDMAASRGWVTINADESITLKDTAFLIMSAFELKGGVMYSLFKNHR